MAKAILEQRRREARKRQTGRGGLIEFIRYFWPVLEPGRQFVDGWPLRAICDHLEAVTFGEIPRLLMNVSPGFMKSLVTNVFWPAWIWGPCNKPDRRFLAFSYAAHLTERDNAKFRDLVRSREYQELWGDRLSLTGDGKVKVSNDKTGWKFASSVGGVGTGERGDVVIIDDPHNVTEGESEAVRTSTVNWFNEAVQNRLNDLATGAIVVIMQRVNEADVSGEILENYPNYVHLCIPMEYDSGRHCETSIGWSDPREEGGELAWPERFCADDLAVFKRFDFLWASQYQQCPEPRGGGILKRDYWKYWDEEAMRLNDVKPGTFPSFEYLVASFDGAYTEKEENDPSACTVWGVWLDWRGNPQIMLVGAWSKRLPLHGPSVEPKKPGESVEDFEYRRTKDQGVVELLADTCRKHKVDKLLIESKATGISVYQEIRRLHADENWAIQLIDPGRLDKVARVYAATPLFTDGMIWCPDTEWASSVVDQCAVFPHGAHDDLVDTVSQALNFLRKTGFALRPSEHEAIMTERQFPSTPKARVLYDV